MQIGISEFFEYLVLVVFGIIAIVNPLSTVPLFISLSAHMDEVQRNALAVRTAAFMAAILLGFLAAGALVLEFFGISIGALQMAGGLVITYLGFRMLFPNPEPAPLSVRNDKSQNIALVPLAMPMLSGPGAIAVIIGLDARVREIDDLGTRAIGFAIVGLGVLICVLISWTVLRLSGRLVKSLSPASMDAMTRLFGFLLVCIGVEFARSGIVFFIAEHYSTG